MVNGCVVLRHNGGAAEDVALVTNLININLQKNKQHGITSG